MNLFIDTNILLDFYHLSGEDVEELRKLVALVKKGNIILYTTDQLIEEFRRNRENKISAAISEFRKVNLKVIFPAFCKIYSEFYEIQSLLKEINEKHFKLYEKVMSDIEADNLKADEIIGELFEQAQKN